MSLGEEQHAFLMDVAKLIIRASQLGYRVTGGELYRTEAQEEIYVKEGLSHTFNSNHLRRLAIDLNTFVGDVDKIPYDLGEYWESLHPLNRWGGTFTHLKDYNHFERNVP